MQDTDRARALVIRHRHMVRNREDCLLSRAACGLGLPAAAAQVGAHVKGGLDPNTGDVYTPSHVGLS